MHPCIDFLNFFHVLNQKNCYNIWMTIFSVNVALIRLFIWRLLIFFSWKLFFGINDFKRFYLHNSPQKYALVFFLSIVDASKEIKDQLERRLIWKKYFNWNETQIVAFFMNFFFVGFIFILIFFSIFIEFQITCIFFIILIILIHCPIQLV